MIFKDFGVTRDAGETVDVGVDAGVCSDDLLTDPFNCGSCDHDCLGADCVDGRCLSQELLPDQSGTQGLIAFEGRLFWVTLSGEVSSCIPERCEASWQIHIAGERSPVAIAVTDTQLFWSNADFPSQANARVMACTRGDCSQTADFVVRRAPEIVLDLIVDRGRLFYSAANQNSGSLRSCEVERCEATDTLMLASLAEPLDIAVDEERVYWVERAGRRVASCGREGCIVPEIIASEQAGPVSLALVATHVYWVNQQGGSVMRCPKAGCGGGPETIVSGVDAPSGVAVDDRFVYWTSFTAGKIQYCAKEGCAQAQDLATGQLNPLTNTQDQKAVYWSNFGDGQTTAGAAIAGSANPPR